MFTIGAAGVQASISLLVVDQCEEGRSKLLRPYGQTDLQRDRPRPRPVHYESFGSVTT